MQLSHLVTTQILLWCILGVAVHGWPILCYPLAWIGIVAMFVVVDLIYDRVHNTEERLRLTSLFRRSATKPVPTKIAVPRKAVSATSN